LPPDRIKTPILTNAESRQDSASGPSGLSLTHLPILFDLAGGSVGLEEALEKLLRM